MRRLSCLLIVLLLCFGVAQAKTHHHRVPADDTVTDSATTVTPIATSDAPQPQAPLLDGNTASTLSSGTTDTGSEASHPLSLTPTDATPEKKPADDPLSFTNMFNILMRLILVLIIGYGLSLGYKRYLSGGFQGIGLAPGQRPQQRSLRILETIPLGQGRHVHLVSVGNRRYLVGATAQQIALLDEVTENTATVETAPAGEAAASKPLNPAFMETLAKFAAALEGTAGETPAAGHERSQPAPDSRAQRYRQGGQY